VRGLQAGYGRIQAVFDVDFAVERGSVVTLLGRNGMGKTTTLCAVMGIVKPSGGSVLFDGLELAGHPANHVARQGIGYVPEGRHVFSNLTVRENLVATARAGAGESGWSVARVVELFPGLRERLHHFGSQLSGGEQQMVAIGRALMTNPKLLVLDEATEGLAPLVREAIWRALTTLKDEGLTILIVDKNLQTLLDLADRHYILEKGKVVWTGSSAELRAASEVAHGYLGV
jgi:branched-chain amino acid transport system ATP-binding protein